MQIEIDFDVFKALTALRESESDSYNAVIRRLLKLPNQHSENALASFLKSQPGAAPNALSRWGTGTLPASELNRNALLHAMGGAWYNGVHFPEETKFKATYKGRVYLAVIKDGNWVGSDGIVRTSPSDAAGAISGTNVNGWRFWHGLRPGDADWFRLDELKA